MSELSTAPMHRILRKAGAPRVSEEAAEALRRTLEEFGLRVAEQAVILSQHAGRRTVKREDIEQAYKLIMKQV